ncbi:flagellar hook-basal body complex protein FliE [Ornithinibacillus sp. 4-3]|uniref:Flagellar hook-basal body complex protein FliE n=1 Tax=Ornithinibacillus sp. 4-3 TaxID=3231488 RepID=A0AB39HUK7_9BACI
MPNEIAGVSNVQLPLMKSNAVTTPTETQVDFGKVFKGALENLDNMQKASDAKTEALIRGDIDDLHDVMITAQKASLTLETTVQIHRRVIDAYNDVMRMQL